MTYQTASTRQLRYHRGLKLSFRASPTQSDMSRRQIWGILLMSRRRICSYYRLTVPGPSAHTMRSSHRPVPAGNGSTVHSGDCNITLCFQQR
eukprot:403942-Hanusia_phi.AAC.2